MSRRTLLGIVTVDDAIDAVLPDALEEANSESLRGLAERTACSTPPPATAAPYHRVSSRSSAPPSSPRTWTMTRPGSPPTRWPGAHYGYDDAVAAVADAAGADRGAGDLARAWGWPRQGSGRPDPRGVRGQGHAGADGGAVDHQPREHRGRVRGAGGGGAGSSGSPPYLPVPVGAAFFVWVLVLRGSYPHVERIFLVACLVYLAYPISGFMAHPDWADSRWQSVTVRACHTDLAFAC